MFHIALDNRSGYLVNIFLFLQENIYCGRLLEVPLSKALLKSIQNICFHGEIRIISVFFGKKNIYMSYLELWFVNYRRVKVNGHVSLIILN